MTTLPVDCTEVPLPRRPLRQAGMAAVLALLRAAGALLAARRAVVGTHARVPSAPRLPALLNPRLRHDLGLPEALLHEQIDSWRELDRWR